MELGSELEIKQVGSMHVLEDLNGAKHVGITSCPELHLILALI